MKPPSHFRTRNSEVSSCWKSNAAREGEKKYTDAGKHCATLQRANNDRSHCELVNAQAASGGS